MTSITIRQLHDQTGMWLRKAAELGGITVTDRGKPVARLVQAGPPSSGNKFRERRLLPAYKKYMDLPIGGRDVTEIISEDRDRPLDV
jgi:antitoxin (DNA-binding transcriptional repressor) of toxin-antitoxin stability system